MNLAVREQIVKTVVKSGNGGAVWVPKGWLGQEVVVILPQKPKLEIKEKIIHLLEPYLKDIISVFIYGSYARHEQIKESDIDVMVITKDKEINKKIFLRKNFFANSNLEITAFELEKFKKAIQKYPVMYYQIVQEAEPLINAHVLDELKGIKIDYKNFKNYLEETKEHIKSSNELLELDKLEGGNIKSYSIAYSIILRLRGIFIVKCIFDKEKFSNKNLKKWLIINGVSASEFEQFYSVYRAVRDSKKISHIIKISSAEKLLNILEKELNTIKARIHDK